MADNNERKDRSKDVKVLEEVMARFDERMKELNRDVDFLEQTKRNFRAWLAAKPVPHWGTEREKKS